MTRGKGKQRILTGGEIEDIKGQRQEAESALRQADSYGAGTAAAQINRTALQNEVKHYNKVLEEGKAPQVRGANKDSMVAESKKLEGEIREGLPTRFEMDHPSKAPGAVHKHMNWAKRNEEKLRRYKHIQRILEPQDPTATDIERFRKEK